MIKKKTSKSAAKRFRKTASGKLKHDRAGGGHLMSNKSRKRKRGLRRGKVLSHADHRRIAAMV